MPKITLFDRETCLQIGKMQDDCTASESEDSILYYLPSYIFGKTVECMPDNSIDNDLYIRLTGDPMTEGLVVPKYFIASISTDKTPKCENNSKELILALIDSNTLSYKGEKYIDEKGIQTLKANIERILE